MKTAVIIGGGASGLAAAITLAESYGRKDLKIIIAERMDRLGKKLAATGNGTCNITNKYCTPERYHGDVKAAQKIIERYPPEAVTERFLKIGVLCTLDKDGKMYPFSRQASSVLDCLRARAAALGIAEKCKCEVTAVKKKGDKFLLDCSDGEKITADAVILAAGGKTAPSLGGSDSGYTIAAVLGHTVTALSPAIVQLKTETGKIKPLKGVKTDTKITLLSNDSVIAEQTGELLFTEYGISGPPVLQISRPVGAKKGSYRVKIDFMPEFSENQVRDILKRRKNDLYTGTLESFFTGMLSKRIGQTLAKIALSRQLSFKISELIDNDLDLLAKTIKGFELPVTGTLSWQNAQVTAGGIPLDQFDNQTLMSKRCAGLFAAGEILNVDGDCGGFNLQWAWSSGITAGAGAAAYLE